jgi:hypothetical protein
MGEGNLTARGWSPATIDVVFTPVSSRPIQKNSTRCRLRCADAGFASASNQQQIVERDTPKSPAPRRQVHSDRQPRIGAANDARRAIGEGHGIEVPPRGGAITFRSSADASPQRRHQVRLPKSGRSILPLLLTNARRRAYRIWALEAPIECKDLLKERGYRWNGGEDGRPRAWYRDLDRDLVAEEERFLAEKIYDGGDCRHELIRIDYSNRFSDRV